MIEYKETEASLKTKMRHMPTIFAFIFYLRKRYQTIVFGEMKNKMHFQDISIKLLPLNHSQNKVIFQLECAVCTEADRNMSIFNHKDKRLAEYLQLYTYPSYI